MEILIEDYRELMRSDTKLELIRRALIDGVAPYDLEKICKLACGVKEATKRAE